MKESNWPVHGIAIRSQEEVKDQNQFLAGLLLEDKITDLWPEYPYLYDVRYPDFKNRDMREMTYLEIVNKLEKSGKTHAAIIQKCLIPYLSQYSLQYVNVTVKSLSDYSGCWV